MVNNRQDHSVLTNLFFSDLNEAEQIRESLRVIDSLRLMGIIVHIDNDDTDTCASTSSDISTGDMVDPGREDDYHDYSEDRSEVSETNNPDV
mmetsp:Transcript_22861/g.52388  ORF Transcript_22861/g.52388 Transcript_22861/m.52388 type:complete len:92 (-) Transcript_22861:493-768(-)